MTRNNIDIKSSPKSRSTVGSPEAVLFHYTTYFGMAGIISSKAIWCGQIQYLNDTSELRHGLDILAEVCRRDFDKMSCLSGIWDRAKGFREVNVFVCSFTDAGDLLSQWRGYTGEGGVALEFSFDKLKVKAKEANFSLEKCVYSEAEKVELTREFLRKNLSDSTLRTSENGGADRLIWRFLPIAARFKHSSFAEEQEWRLISRPIPLGDANLKVRATSRGLVPYMHFDLIAGKIIRADHLWGDKHVDDICISGVTIGPNREQELQMSAVHPLFEAHGVHWGGTRRSFIPYRML